MEKRKLGNREIVPIGLGCMSLSQGYLPLPEEDDALRLLHEAVDYGYEYFDTARLYGRGKNEELLQKFLKTRRDEVYLASKCGLEFGDGKRWVDCKPETIRRAVDKSLQTMQVDFIDLYYLHRRDFNVPIEESVGALGELVAEGKIGAIGLSEMSAETLERAVAEHPIAAMQTEYSLWTRNPELGVLEACAKLGTTFVSFSPVGRGALADTQLRPDTFDEKDLRAPYPRFHAPHWEHNSELIKQLTALAEAQGATLAQLSLAWVLSRGDHVVAIPGTANMDHMRENFDTMSKPIGAEVLEQAGEIMNQSTVSGHRYPEGAMRKSIDTEDYVA